MSITHHAPVMVPMGDFALIDHHYRGAVSNTLGAPLSFPLWGHVPLEQTPSLKQRVAN